MTDEERAEYELLKLASEKAKFGLQVGWVGDQSQRDALERLQIREWIRLIDVSPIAEHPDRVFRIFILTPPALEWLRKHAN